MAEFKPSVYQQRIFKAVKEGLHNLLIVAVAGSGKTFTIVESIKYLHPRMRVLFLAFNKSIQLELEKKLPSRVAAKTINAVGHGAWCRFVGRGVRVNLDTNKIKKLAKRVVVGKDSHLASTVQDLCRYAKVHGLVPEDSRLGTLMEDTTRNWEWIFYNHKIQIQDLRDLPRAIQLARVVLIRGLKQKSVIDYADQLYMTYAYNVPLPWYDRIFVDECQDLSAIRRAIIHRLMARNARAIFVGDPNQAIYGFAGADSKSVKNIEEEFNTKQLPLTVCYRCGENIVEHAKEYVSHLEARPRPSGFDPKTASSKAVLEQMGEVQDLGLYTDLEWLASDLVVCRNNAPLLRLCHHLLRRRVPFQMLGRDIGEQMVDLIFSLSKRGMTIESFLPHLDKWYAKLMEKAEDTDDTKLADQTTDKYDSVKALIELFECRTVNDLCDEIKAFFKKDDVNRTYHVTLCTVHKAKGLESDTVFILDPWIMEKNLDRPDNLPWETEQEENLIYVARTRAKYSLAYIDSPKRG